MALKTHVLIFGSHPDDAEIACGGTISLFTSSGAGVRIVDLTLGELGTRGTVSLRQLEAGKAAKILGVLSRENLKLKDGNIENTPVNRLKVISVIRKYSPEIVFLPYPSDRHPDHINASKLVRESSFYSGLAKVKTKLGGKKQNHHRPSKMIYYMQTTPFEPSFIVDITGTFVKKMESLQCYGSQFYRKNNKGPETFISDSKYMEFIEARAVFYGFLIGAKYGEPFYSEEKLQINPLSLLKKN